MGSTSCKRHVHGAVYDDHWFAYFEGADKKLTRVLSLCWIFQSWSSEEGRWLRWGAKGRGQRSSVRPEESSHQNMGNQQWKNQKILDWVPLRMHWCCWSLAMCIYLQEQCRQIRQKENGCLLLTADERSKTLQAKRNPRARKTTSSQKLGKDWESWEKIIVGELSFSGERTSWVREVRALKVSLLGVRIGETAELAKEKREEDEYRTI